MVGTNRDSDMWDVVRVFTNCRPKDPVIPLPPDRLTSRTKKTTFIGVVPVKVSWFHYSDLRLNSSLRLFVESDRFGPTRYR